MALEKQVISVNFSQGLDTKTDPKQVLNGKLLVLQNGVFSSPQRIRKRFGYSGFSQMITGTVNNISNGTTLDSYNNELVMTDGSTLYSRSTSNNTWTSKGSITNVSLSTTPIIRNEYQQTSQDSCFHPAGIKCFVWEDTSGGSRFTVTNSNTGQQYISNGLLATTYSVPKCYAIGNYILITVFDSVSGNIKYGTVSTINPTTISSFTDLIIDSSNPPAYDGQVIGTKLYVTYNNSTGGVSTLWISGTLIISSQVTVADSAQTISLFGDPSNNIWVVFYNGTKVRAIIYDSNLSTTPVLGITDIETVSNVYNVTGYFDTTKANLFYTITGSPNYNYFIRTNSLTLSGTVGTASTLIRSVCLFSKAFVYNAKGYIVVSYASAIQPTYFVLDNTGLIIAKFSSETGAGIPAKKLVSNATAISSGVFQLSFLQKDFVTSSGGNVYSFLGVMGIILDFTQTQTQTVQIASVLHITGGLLWMYDGVSPVEHGFLLFPENPTQSTSGAGGAILAGTYQYVALYEWVDNAGNIHRSAPSQTVTVVTTGSTSTNTITVTTLRVTEKSGSRSPVSIVLYRTQANQPIFYRVSSTTSLTYNSVTADTVVFTDTLVDTAIVGNQQLYTTGGELEAIPAPVPLAMAIYKNRLLVVDSENPKSFWYSKQVAVGNPVEFNDSFVQNVEERGGDLAGLFQLDDKLIAFKQSDIYFMVGDGPAPSGVNNDFNQLQLITSDVGLNDKNSIAQTPQGLMFKAIKGIYLLDRSLSVSYIGYDVDSYNDSAITSAQLMVNANEVRFTTDGGVCLAYDYLVGQWSVFTNIAAVDSAIFQGLFTYLRATGKVLQEDQNSFTDDGEFVALKIQTSWMKVSDLQGFQRVRRMELLGEWISNHQLLVQISYNYNPYSTQQEYIDTSNYANIPVYGEDSPYGSGSPYGGIWPSYQYRINLATQKCEALQVSIEDTQASDFGEGYNISALTFEVGVKKGMFKLPASQKFG